MPLVPEFNHKPLRPIYVPTSGNEPATLKQKSFIMTLYRRRELPVPDLKQLTKGQASVIISNMLDNTVEIEEQRG